MKAIVRPRFGCIEYREGVFTDVDKYFERLVTGDITSRSRVPFECPGCPGDRTVDESKIYFSLVVQKLEDIVKHRKTILNADVRENIIFVYPSFIIDPFMPSDPDIVIFENLEGYTFARIYDKDTGRPILVQKIHWNFAKGIDKNVFNQYLTVYLPALMENTVRYLKEVVGNYNLDGDVEFIE